MSEMMKSEKSGGVHVSDQVQQMPKVQLHDHLDGGLRPESILELADAQGVTLPESDPKALGEWFFRGAARSQA